MHVSEGVEWAAHCAVVLSLVPADAALPAASLAEYHGVPGAYLAKTLQGLARAGIVTSVAGRHGGYRLARPAADISLLDVIQAVEGDEMFFRCTEIRRRGPCRVSARSYSPVCAIAGSMWRAEEAWQSELRATTIADLAGEVGRQAPEAAINKSVRWLSRTLAPRSTPA